MTIQRIHHVAYRCVDAQETVDFYTNVLGMDYIMAISEDRVPSTGEPDPYMHIFFDAGQGSCLAFFELPNSPPMGKDPNTPEWVQHIAFQVPDEETLLSYKARVESHGLDVVGVTDHGIFKSIYFFDPSGHRLELATPISPPEKAAELARLAPEMLAEWNRSKKTVRHAAWLHEREFGKSRGDAPAEDE